MNDEMISTNGSLDCCSKEEINKNKEKHLTCDICNNTGFLSPRTDKQREDYKEGYEQGKRDKLEKVIVMLDKIERYRMNLREYINNLKQQLTSQNQTPHFIDTRLDNESALLNGESLRAKLLNLYEKYMKGLSIKAEIEELLQTKQGKEE